MRLNAIEFSGNGGLPKNSDAAIIHLGLTMLGIL